jgi:hypothetical protein
LGLGIGELTDLEFRPDLLESSIRDAELPLVGHDRVVPAEMIYPQHCIAIDQTQRVRATGIEKRS